MASHVDRHAVSNVYSTPWRINSDYLPADSRCNDQESLEDPDDARPEDWL